MSDVTILNLPVAIGLTGTEYVPVVQSGVTKRAQTQLLGTLATLPSISNNTLLANVSGSAAQPSSTTVTALLDSAIGSTQGQIMYRSGSAWVALGAGTSGYFLKTQGASANPTWDAVTASAAGSNTQVQLNSSGSLGASANLAFSASTLAVGVAGSATGALALSGATSGTVTVQPAAAAGTWSLTLPTSGGTSGYVLRTDGAGATSWVAQSGSPAGSNTQVQFNSSGSFGSSANLTFSTSTLTVGAAASATGILALTGSTSGTISIQGQAAAGTYNFNLPTGAGTSGQPLLSGGGGATAMSFGTLSVSGGGTGQTSLTNHGVLVGAATSGITALAVAAAGTLLAGVASSDPAFTATPTLGVQQTTQGQLILANTAVGAFPTTLQSSNSATAAWTLTLPTTAGSSGQALTTNGSGVASWTSIATSPAGSNTQVQFNSSGSFGASANLTFATSTLTVGAAGAATGTLALTGSTSGMISIQGQAAAGTYNFNLPTSAGTSGQPLLSGGGSGTAMSFGTLSVGAGGTGLTSGTSGGVPYFSSSSAMTSSGALTSGAVVLGGGAGSAPNVSANLTFSGSTLSVGANASALGALKLYGSTSGDVTVQATAVAGTATVFQLPASNGSSGQFLQTNGSGVTSWQTASAGAGGSTTQVQYNSSGSLAGSANLTFDGTDLSLGSSSRLLWSSDLILLRNAAAKLQLGAADAAAPVAQTLLVQSVVAGTSNTAGTDFTIGGSKSTGNAAGGALQFSVSLSGTSGTSQNALTNIVKLAGTGHLLWNTDNTYDIGASGATRPKNIYAGTLVTTPTVTATTLRFGSSINDGVITLGAASMTFGYISNSLNRVYISGGLVALTSSHVISWSNSSSDANNTPDTGFYRDAAGVVQVNNGTAGTYRDLKLRNLIPGASLSTAMTDGFFNLPGAAGAPSGTPNNTTGFPSYWDSTNLQLYVYTGGAWKKSAAFT